MHASGIFSNSASACSRSTSVHVIALDGVLEERQVERQVLLPLRVHDVSRYAEQAFSPGQSSARIIFKRAGKRLYEFTAC